MGMCETYSAPAKSLEEMAEEQEQNEATQVASEKPENDNKD